jgi:hypothetical protein
MRYYIANLILHFAITAIFVVLTCVFAARNRKHKTKHVFTYFFPILFAIVALVDIILYTAPRMLDINGVVNNNYYYNSGTVEKIGFMKNYFVIDGKYYYLNPMRNTLSEGDTIRVKHTQYSSYTVDWTTVPEVNLSEGTSSTEETES